MSAPRQIVLKGFIRKAQDGAYEGICLTLNLAVRGRSMDEAEGKLHKLIGAYLEDVEREGSWKEFVPRRAPFSYYLTYNWYCLLAALHALGDFKLFVESVPTSMAHA